MIHSVLQRAAVPFSNSTRTESVIHIFTDNPDGKNPYSGLLPSGKGTAYGMTEYGGTVYHGTVFKLDQAGKVSIIHNFLAGSDGENPCLTDLISDAAGNLYGTTSQGGTNPILCSCGVVFKLGPSAQETILHRFTQGPNDGTFPEAGLVRDPAGNLYGTTFFGGNVCRYSNADGGCGTIFRISPTGKETILYNFTGGAEGANPAGRLLLDSAGNLYGTTAYGGIACDTYGFGCGAIFKLDTSGKIRVLHTFSGAPMERIHSGDRFPTRLGMLMASPVRAAIRPVVILLPLVVGRCTNSIAAAS